MTHELPRGITAPEGRRAPRVERVEAFGLSYALPPGREYGSAKTWASHRTATLVRITTDDGVEGWGECYGPTEPAVALVNRLGADLLGQRVDGIAATVSRHLSANYDLARAGVYAAALSGLDLALWDAWARSLGVSVGRLIGGRVRDEVTAYASTGYSTSPDEQERFVRSIRDAVDMGFEAVKIRAGLGPDRDEERIWAAREALGPSRRLMVDFNGNYSADTAITSLRRVEGAAITWAEEPVPSDDMQGLAHLRRHVSVSIAGGEGLSTRFAFRELLARRLIDIAQPDLTLCGGLSEAIAIAAMGSAWNVRLSPHVWGGAVGQAASLQFAAMMTDLPSGRVVPEPAWFEWDCGENPLRDALLVTPIEVHDGRVEIPEGPGWGVDVEMAAVEEYAILAPS